jgi:hypothetical protein
LIRRTRFRGLVRTQLELFEQEHGDLLSACETAAADYDAAPREEAEERYGDYLLLVEEGAELLVEMRDRYALTLDEEAAETYAAAFDRSAARRFPRFARDLT